MFIILNSKMASQLTESYCIFKRLNYDKRRIPSPEC